MSDGHSLSPQFTGSGLTVPKERSRTGWDNDVNASNTSAIQINPTAADEQAEARSARAAKDSPAPRQAAPVQVQLAR